MMNNKESGVAVAFWYVGGVNALAAIIAVLVFIFGGLAVQSNAVAILIAGVSGMLVCFAIATIVQHLCNIDHRLNSNNKLLSQLIRAYGHKPEE